MHVQLHKDAQGRMACFKRAIEPYIVPIDQAESAAYSRLRIAEAVAA